MILSATLVKGSQFASGAGYGSLSLGTIKQQKPFYEKHGFDLDEFFKNSWTHGTLNFSTTPYKVSPRKPYKTFHDIEWHPHIRETFLLTPLHIKFNNTFYHALHYFIDPQTKYGGAHPPGIMEIIAETIPAITYGNVASLVINPENFWVSS